MAAEAAAAKAGLEKKERIDDRTLLEEGAAALTDRLGPSGMLRFLALVGGQADRFEDIRREWEDMSQEDIVAARGRRPGTSG